MTRKKWVAAAGQDWFIRMKGASALKQVRCLKYWGNDIWSLGGSMYELPFDAQAGVDFVFAGPARGTPTVGEPQK